MRRGAINTMEMIILILVVLLFVWVSWDTIKDGVNHFRGANKCDPSQCVATSEFCGGESMREDWSKVCGEGQKCCVPTGPATNKPSALGPDGKPLPPPKVKYALPDLDRVSLQGHDAAWTAVSSGAQKPVLAGTADTLILTGTAQVHHLSCVGGKVDKKDVEITNKPEAVSMDDWIVNVTVRSKTGGIVYNESTKGLATGSTLPSKGPVKDAKLSVDTNAPDDTCVDNVPFSLTLTTEFTGAQAGQEYQVLVNVYPKKLGAHPDLERQYNYWYKVVEPIRYSGLSQGWGKKKDVTVWCNNPMNCENVYFTVTAESQCPPFSTTTAELPVPTTQYCIAGYQEAQLRNIGCFDTEDVCRGKFSSLVPNTDYMTVSQQIARNFGTNTDLSTYYQAFTKIQDNAAPSMCVLRSVSNVQEGLFYRVSSFDRATQRGTITLDMPWMANGTLCVYGKPGDNGQVKTYNSSQRINIDLQPPKVTAKFDPWKLKLTFSCVDTGGSGCKAAMGVAYISDANKFLSALGAGPNHAELHCPPPASGAYTPETRREVVYTDTAVRVLCVKGEDQAGNGAVAMVTVFNGYDTLAKSIAMAVNR